MVFLNSFKKIVIALDVEDFQEYSKQDHINVIVSDVFQVLTRGVPSNLRVLYATSLSLKTQIHMNKFSENLWQFMTNPSKRASELSTWG